MGFAPSRIHASVLFRKRKRGRKRTRPLRLSSPRFDATRFSSLCARNKKTSTSTSDDHQVCFAFALGVRGRGHGHGRVWFTFWFAPPRRRHFARDADGNG